ncbi:MAG: hypothetical protein WAT31_00030 [Candidatus Saccharimonas aalborgensis]
MIGRRSSARGGFTVLEALVVIVAVIILIAIILLMNQWRAA